MKQIKQLLKFVADIWRSHVDEHNIETGAFVRSVIDVMEDENEKI